MTWEIHRVMQDSQNLCTFGSGAIEDDMPSFVITIRRADDLITFSSHLRFCRKIGESIFKLFHVFEALFSPSIFIRVMANFFQV